MSNSLSTSKEGVTGAGWEGFPPSGKSKKAARSDSTAGTCYREALPPRYRPWPPPGPALAESTGPLRGEQGEEGWERPELRRTRRGRRAPAPWLAHSLRAAPCASSRDCAGTRARAGAGLAESPGGRRAL